jgi:outer membrane protein assembly factor BamE (lipoprotein component of BamABCDE complex)
MRGNLVAKLALAAALSLSLAGCVGYDGDLQHGYVADERLLEQVKMGSSAEQVLVVLGTLRKTTHSRLYRNLPLLLLPHP